MNGARPGEMPIEQPSGMGLVLKEKPARALGLALPASLLTRADRLIG